MKEVFSLSERKMKRSVLDKIPIEKIKDFSLDDFEALIYDYEQILPIRIEEIKKLPLSEYQREDLLKRVEATRLTIELAKLAFEKKKNPTE